MTESCPTCRSEAFEPSPMSPQMCSFCDGSFGGQSTEPYRYLPEHHLPEHTFNRELFPPGTNQSFPEGVVGVRVDEDFFVVATLHWAWSHTPLQEIVSRLWPQVKKPQFGPDTGEFICQESSD